LAVAGGFEGFFAERLLHFVEDEFPAFDYGGGGFGLGVGLADERKQARECD
jgi:hypothetical protein